MIDRTCARCGVNIGHRDKRSRHCSSLCRNRDYEGAATGTIRSCRHCGAAFAPTKRTHVYCSATCRSRSDIDRNREAYNRRNSERRARERGAVVDGQPFTRSDVFERDGYICQLCFTPINWTLTGRHPMAPSLDHVVPLNKGGEHTLANTWTVHFACNASKGDRDVLTTPVPLHSSEWHRLEIV